MANIKFFVFFQKFMSFSKSLCLFPKVYVFGHIRASQNFLGYFSILHCFVLWGKTDQCGEGVWTWICGDTSLCATNRAYLPCRNKIFSNHLKVGCIWRAPNRKWLLRNSSGPEELLPPARKESWLGSKLLRIYRFKSKTMNYWPKIDKFIVSFSR